MPTVNPTRIFGGKPGSHDEMNPNHEVVMGYPTKPVPHECGTNVMKGRTPTAITLPPEKQDERNLTWLQ